MGLDGAVQEQLPALEDALDDNIEELLRQFSAEARGLVDEEDKIRGGASSVSKSA